MKMVVKTKWAKSEPAHELQDDDAQQGQHHEDPEDP
jgi:hypothetical protein